MCAQSQRVEVPCSRCNDSPSLLVTQSVATGATQLRATAGQEAVRGCALALPAQGEGAVKPHRGQSSVSLLSGLQLRPDTLSSRKAGLGWTPDVPWQGLRRVEGRVWSRGSGGWRRATSGWFISSPGSAPHRSPGGRVGFSFCRTRWTDLFQNQNRFRSKSRG